MAVSAQPRRRIPFKRLGGCHSDSRPGLLPHIGCPLRRLTSPARQIYIRSLSVIGERGGRGTRGNTSSQGAAWCLFSEEYLNIKVYCSKRIMGRLTFCQGRGEEGWEVSGGSRENNRWGCGRRRRGEARAERCCRRAACLRICACAKPFERAGRETRGRCHHRP